MSVANVKSYWSSGNLIFTEKIVGNNAIVQFGVDDDGIDVKFMGATSGAYMLWDESADTQVFEGGAKLSLTDDILIKFGDSDDVTMEWDTAATPDEFQVVPAADDTIFTFGVAGATQKSFDVRIYGGAANGADYFTFDAGASALLVGGDSRIDFSNATVLAGNTDGGIIKAGTSGSPVTEDTADMKFMAFYFDNGATSGDNRGMYLRQYLTGAGGGGDALRVFNTVSNVAGANANGAHISLNFGTTGSITGLGVASKATLHVPNQEQSAGTYFAGLSEVYFDGASSGLSGTTMAAIHSFQVNGSGHTNDMGYVFHMSGLNTTQLETTFSGTPDAALKCEFNGTIYWMCLATATS